MARTRSSYIPTGVASKGLGIQEFARGVNRLSRGLVTDYPLGVAPVDSPLPAPLDPLPLLSTTALDANGFPRLLSDDIVSLHFAHVGQELFANPDKEYSGYAANGFWYTSGVLDPTHVPFKAPWASEGESDPTIDRNDLDSFPSRLIVALTRAEAALFDADTLEVWMRFRYPTATVGTGTLLGVPGSEPTHVRFVNGLLVVSSNDGLRVADFRNNEVHWLRAASSSTLVQTSRGIEDRAVDDFYDTASTVGGLDRIIQNDNVLSMDAATLSVPSALQKNSKTVIAAGHGAGVSGIVYEPENSVMRVAASGAVLTVLGAWEAQDDGDGDDLTLLFDDTAGAVTNWEGLNVRPGDKITTLPLSNTRTVAEVAQAIPGDHLVLDTPMSLTLEGSGTNYTIQRQITAVLISPEGYLYMAGSSQVSVSRNTDWFDTGEIWGTIGSGFNTSLDTVNLTVVVDNINDMALRGTDLFIATTLGVFHVTDDGLTNAASAGFLYSTAAVTDVDAEYKILEGDDADCRAISIDPETGYIMVAVTDVDSVVTEVNPSIEQGFRFFDNVGRVKALLAYRNPAGPPDKVVT